MTTQHQRAAITAMYLGLALTVVATIVPYVDHATANLLGDHIRAGYPAYSDASITAMFALATSIALFDLQVRDTSGDTGLPPLLGWVGMLPALAGLLTVAFLWRKS